MNFKNGIAFVVVLGSLAIGKTSLAAGITVCLDSFPPAEIHDNENNSNKGFAYDIIRTVMSQNGFEVGYIDAPYSRAIDFTENGVCDVMAQMNDFTNEKIKVSKTAVYLYRSVALVRASDKNNYSFTFESLSNLRFVKIDGYFYQTPLFRKLVTENQAEVITVKGSDGIGRALSMIDSERADAISLIYEVAQHYVDAQSLNGKFRVATGPSNMTPMYIGVSKKSAHAEQIMQAWESGRQQLEDQNLIPGFLRKYGLGGKEELILPALSIQ